MQDIKIFQSGISPKGDKNQLVAASGSFDWLKAEEEDIYSLADGEAVQWPSP